jgi:hypothetical protein
MFLINFAVNQIYHVNEHIIAIANKLEVKPDGSIQVPGCEPVSSLTSLALSRNFFCNSSVIDVKLALSLIPGSKLLKVTTPIGHLGSGFFFVLPEGPPIDGNKCNHCVEDYYKILRENAKPPSPSQAEAVPACSSIENYTGCIRVIDDIRAPRDPNMRPNSNPL